MVVGTWCNILNDPHNKKTVTTVPATTMKGTPLMSTVSPISHEYARYIGPASEATPTRASSHPRPRLITLGFFHERTDQARP